MQSFPFKSCYNNSLPEKPMAETMDKGMTRRRPWPGTMTFSGSSSNAMFKTSCSQMVVWLQFDQTIHFGLGEKNTTNVEEFW